MISNNIKEEFHNICYHASIGMCSFEDVEIAYEISLPSREWEVALQSCLDHYHSLSLTDKQIDTWKLLEVARTWH